MKNALFILGAGTVLASACVLGGCGKQAAPRTVVEAKLSPTPTPSALTFDRKDFDADKLRSKANQAVDSLGKMLENEDPKLRAKFQRLSNKLADRLEQDKDHWREKLKAKRQDLEPQIEKLKERLGREGGQAKDKLRADLEELQKQSDTTDQKLSKLESIGKDAWKQFKTRLREEEKREKTPPVDEDGDDGGGSTAAPRG